MVWRTMPSLLQSVVAVRVIFQSLYHTNNTWFVCYRNPACEDGLCLGLCLPNVDQCQQRITLCVLGFRGE
jgi:hypothetical protein